MRQPPTGQPRTGNQVLADILLQPEGLASYLAKKRYRGASYETIARDLHDDTGGQVSVTYKTIDRWLLELDVKEAARR